MEFKLTGIIVGGPHDGKSLRYQGSVESLEALDKMDKFLFDGHTYKVIEFDKEKMHVVLMW